MGEVFRKKVGEGKLQKIRICLGFSVMLELWFWMNDCCALFGKCQKLGSKVSLSNYDPVRKPRSNIPLLFDNQLMFELP